MRERCEPDAGARRRPATRNGRATRARGVQARHRPCAADRRARHFAGRVAGGLPFRAVDVTRDREALSAGRSGKRLAVGLHAGLGGRDLRDAARVACDRCVHTPTRLTRMAPGCVAVAQSGRAGRHPGSLFERVRERMRSAPGVRSVSYARSVPSMPGQLWREDPVQTDPLQNAARHG